ncbi:26S proteasome subunit RPN7, partial [Colletotrichum orchidophilum]
QSRQSLAGRLRVAGGLSKAQAPNTTIQRHHSLAHTVTHRAVSISFISPPLVIDNDPSQTPSYKSTAKMGSDPQYAKYPLLPLAQHVFALTNAYASRPSQQSAAKALNDAITEHKMAPLYRYLAHPLEGILNQVGEGGSQIPGKPLSRKSSLAGMIATKTTPTAVNLPWDEGRYQELKADNDKELEEFQKEEDEAVEKAGETEIQAARGKRAEFWARVGDKDRAIAAYEDVFEKTGILGTKIDLVLAIIRMGLFYGDKLLVKKHVERAKTLVESGGDWDRRNRLKAYEGIYLLTVRSYNLAAPLLLDSLSTFTSYELCTYSSLVVYSVLAGSVSLKRVDFKSKVVDAPEIKAILGDGEDKLLALSGALSAGPGADDAMHDAPPAAAKTAVNLTTLGTSTDQPEAEMAIDFSPLAQLVSSLYNGQYKYFFQALAQVEESFLTQDRYLHEHKNWFIREMRLRAYQQLLQSYRVVGLETMATDFGVTVDFLDRDLAKFIAAGRIPCTIDRVSGKGVIETNRPDDKNKQYQDVVRQGDQLITKLQKYGQAVRLRGSERA